ncbi:MAG: cation:proton antiporter [Litorivicinaceae bacterium]
MMTLLLIWLVGAWAIGSLVRFLGMPPLVGYLVAGAVFAATGFDDTADILAIPAEIGVELLLFAIGLKMNPRALLRGDLTGITLGHLLISGLLIVGVMGSTLPLEVRFGLAMTLGFSSTVVAAKALEARREIRAFHGRLSISILVLQDIAAVALLAVGGGQSPSVWALGLLAIPFAAPVARAILDRLAIDAELELLLGLIVALLLGAAVFKALGVSGELGALVMGMVFSNHRAAKPIAQHLWGLRELLLIAFFVRVGMQVPLSAPLLMDALPFLALLPIKMAVLFALLLWIRLRAYTAFLMVLTLLSYSEFALIVAASWADSGLISGELLSIFAITVTLSFMISAPLNRYSHELYDRFESQLLRFERNERHPDEQPLTLGGAQVVVLGMGRIGTAVFDGLHEAGVRVVGLDADPGKIESHLDAGRRVVFADAEDPGFWNKLRFGKLRAIILTMPEPEALCIAVRRLRQNGFEGIIGVSTRSRHTLSMIESAGADLIYDAHDAAGFGLSQALMRHLNEPQAGYPAPH